MRPQNILAHPAEDKFRVIDLSNAKVAQSIEG
jgi:hypothetical protein